MEEYLLGPAAAHLTGNNGIFNVANTNGTCNDNTLNVTWTGVGISASLIAVNFILSLAFGLGLHWKLIISAARCVGQLTLMGYILVPVLTEENPWYIFGMSAVLLFLATVETTFSKGKRRYRSMFFVIFLALLVGTAPCVYVGTAYAMGADPWYEARQFIPTVGMLLGNALSAVALGINYCLNYVTENRDKVEYSLAMGSTWWEAARPIATEALRIAMLPTLNAMSVMGLVSIPGMMTGQILAGADPLVAVKYQQIMMFLIAASTALASFIAVGITLRVVFDGSHRLRIDRINSADYAVIRVFKKLWKKMKKCCCGCRKAKTHAAYETIDDTNKSERKKLLN